uniref:thiamine biosynthesis protein S n=1 Tax=Rhodaphanes brevistipitata TaxID=446136 RepID=UPI001FCE0C33|nr:thiamine biosynthesis protein S [Rhodaphanes brevistipitata]UNJ18541.1 thiamine biosynthesis protein S [Rhodaphanes brevistipitata]
MTISTTSSPSKITVLINGDPFVCLEGISLANLLNYLDFDFRQIVIEYNSDIVEKEKLHFLTLKNQDIIEIVTMVGGG